MLPARNRASAIALFFVCFAAVFALPGAASAERPLATVNGTAITRLEAIERQRIAAAFEREEIDLKAALERAIDDRLKYAEAGRLGYRIEEPMVDQRLAEYARAAGGAQRLDSQLRSAGLSELALRRKIRADFAWELVLRAAARNIRRLRNAEITAAIGSAQEEGRTLVTDFDLQPIVFIVPQGADPARQMRRALAARKSFSGCRAGTSKLRGSVDVAIKLPYRRSSSEMSPETVAFLRKTPVGRLSEPYATGEGLEMMAVCGLKDRQDITAVRDRIDREASDRALQAEGKRVIERMRARADIVYLR